MQQKVVRRSVMFALVASLTMMVGIFGDWRPAGAQVTDIFNSAPYEQLAGIEYAVQRSYSIVDIPTSSNDSGTHLNAQIVRFDTPENAALGFDALNAYYLDALSTSDYDLMGFTQVEDPAIGTTSRAYTAGFSDSSAGEQTGEASLVQVQDEVFVYTVFGENHYWDITHEEVTLEAATDMIEAIVEAPDTAATPDIGDEGAPSGAWDKFPDEEHAMFGPDGVYFIEDTENFVVEQLPSSVVATYGDVDGLVSNVARYYGVINSTTGEPNQVPFAYVELAAFDEAANSEPAFTSAAVTTLGVQGLDENGLDETEADVPADESVAWAGEVENEGEQFSVAVIVARSGSDVVTVAVVLAGGEDAFAVAEAICQTVIENDAGEGEITLGPDGTSSGGVWDQLPTGGDAVLTGMEPLQDSQYYPEPE